MANSSRPPFPKRKNKRGESEIDDSVERAEDFFTDSLEQWREKNKIDEMVLVGHSLGGYLSAAYALKVKKRIIVFCSSLTLKLLFLLLFFPIFGLFFNSVMIY